MLGYRVPRPDQAMLVSGGKQKAVAKVATDSRPPAPTATVTFKVVIGHGAWVMPGFRKVNFLGLDLHTVDIEEKCRSHEGILLNLQAVVAFKVQADVNAVNAAAQRFLGDQKKGDMETMTVRIFAGHLRSIVGEMPLLDIHRNRDALAQNVIKHSQYEMSTLGLTVDSFQIEHLDDNNVGYLDNLARPFLARQQRDADIATAQAEQESAHAIQEADRKKADQVRETQIQRAAFKAETDRAQAEADAAGPLAQADAQREVLAMKKELAEREAELTQQQLVIDVEKPAQAEANRIKIMADASVVQAEANVKRVKFEAEGDAERTRVAARAEADRNVSLAQAAADAVKLAAEAEKIKGLNQAEVIRQQGLAEADGQRAKAEALAAEDSAQLELRRMELQPEIARAMAEGLGLNNANVTFFDGDGPAKLLAGVVPLSKALWDSFGSGDQASKPATPDVDTAPGTVGATRANDVGDRTSR
jgi:flotillin